MEKRLDKINEDISIYQYTEGFLYGTDAVLLAAYVKLKKGAVCVELGTGTGIIPTLLCHHKNPSKIFAFEIQEDYVALARENAELNGFSDRIEVIHENVRDITPSYLRPYGVEAVDFVVSNPPYMKQTSGALGLSDRKMVARHEMHSDISDFARAGANLLKNGGDMYIVYRPDRLCDLICALRENSLEPKEMCFVHANTFSAPSVVLVKAKKGAASGVNVIEPLFLNLDEDCKTLTDKAKKIYEDCNF
jgi:tRNA1Val (adenine37-N6)-methyltransferase